MCRLYLSQAVGREQRSGTRFACIFCVETNFPWLLVFREAIGYMKEGEEGKTKTYSALIWTNKAIQKNDIGFLNDLKVLCLQLWFVLFFFCMLKSPLSSSLLPASHSTWAL